MSAPNSDLTRHVTVTLPRPVPPEELTGYQWPLIHGRLTLPYGATPWGSRIVAGELFHDGIDLATFCGDRIVGGPRRHRHRGEPSFRWTDRLGGRSRPVLRRLDAKKLWETLPIVVITDDGNGYRSVYAHFEKVVVKPGQTVKAGQLSAMRAGPVMRPAVTCTTGCSAPPNRPRSPSTPPSSSG